MFEVSAGSRGYGQVAVDDISVTSGSCPDPGKKKLNNIFLAIFKNGSLRMECCQIT